MNQLLENIISDFKATPINEMRLCVQRTLKYYYTIKIYERANDDDLKYISENRKKIKQFMDAGYRHAGLGDFLGCYNDKSVKQNTKQLKVAEDAKGNIIAMSIYNGRYGGYKCAGITITTVQDEIMQAMARDAVKHIIMMDISNFREFYWCECSGSIKHYFEKYSGDLLKVPTIYLPAYFGEDFLNNVVGFEPDGYTYTRVIGKNTEYEDNIKKCVFGFPNKQALDDYIKRHNTSIDAFYNKVMNGLRTFESVFTGVPSDIHAHLEIINRFWIDQNDNFVYEFTRHQMEILEKSIDAVDEFWRTNRNKLTPRMKEDVHDMLDNGFEVYDRAEILEPHTLDELYMTKEHMYMTNTTNDEYYLYH